MKNYTIIQSELQLHSMLKKIDEWDYIAFDTETTGLNTRKDKIIGLSICGQTGHAYYLPRLSWYEGMLHQQCEDEVFINVLNILKLKDLLMWNASFDIRMIKSNFGIDLLPALVADVMLMKHTVDEENPFGLKEVAIKVQDKIGFNAEQVANQEQIELKENVAKNGGSTTKSNFEMYKADLEVLGKYACSDADLTFRLAEYYKAEIEKDGMWDFFFEEEVMPLYKEVTIPMEEKGVKLDMKLITENYSKLVDKVKFYEQKVKDALCSTDAFKRWLEDKLEAKYPVSTKGNFAQLVAEYYDLPLPKTDTGKYSINKKTLKDIDHPAAGFLSGSGYILPDDVQIEIQTEMLRRAEGDIINVSSKDHLATLCFNYMGLKPLSKTDSGKDQFDQEFVQSISNKYEWASYLNTYNKLSKIKSSYYDRFLEGQEDGFYYFSYKQHGTISGRYSSDAQQLPRPIEEGTENEDVIYFNNIIRAFMVSTDGRIFIDDDYESLEPHVFAHVSTDEKLRDIFRKGHDFYSTIAIQTEGLHQYSADKKADNYLGKLAKDTRQAAKAYCFTKDTLVLTSEGERPISTLKVGDLVYTRQGLKPISKLFVRKASVGIFSTNRGFLECTPDHKIYNPSTGDFVEAQNFNKGDLVEYNDHQHKYSGSNKKLPIYSSFKFKNGGTRPLGHLDLDEDWSYFLGAMLGDGIISIAQNRSKGYGHGLKGYVGICGLPEDKVTSKVCEFFNSLGYNMRESTPDRKCSSMVTVNSELCKIVYDTLKLGDMEADIKKKSLKVPDYMFEQSDQRKVAFIAGLLDTDGYVKKIGNTSNVVLCSKDSRLISGVQRLLCSLGVEATCSRDWNKTYKRFYYLLRIGIKGICKLQEDYKISQYMVVDRKRDTFEKSKVIANRKVNSPKFIGFQMIEGEQDVYDIRVEDSHEFYANGILVHNCLGIPYGMSAYALAMALEIPKDEAKRLHEGYLSGFPDLAQWMESSEDMAKNLGYVVTMTGRKRHLPKVKELHKRFGDKLLDFKSKRTLESRYGAEQVKQWAMDYKNGLNNAKNFQIQGLSASIVNRAAIAITRRFKAAGIDGWVCAQIHDQLIFDVPYYRKEEAAAIVQDCMENTTKISIALKAKPSFANNWKEGH